MNKSAHKIRIGTATEDQVNQEFTDARHRAQKGEITEPEEHLYFLEPDNFLKILSDKRLALLYTLRSMGTVSIQALSKILERNYKNVCQDIRLLKKAGLIRQTDAENIFVP